MDGATAESDDETSSGENAVCENSFASTKVHVEFSIRNWSVVYPVFLVPTRQCPRNLTACSFGQVRLIDYLV
jgi:hypothetical protein